MQPLGKAFTPAFIKGFSVVIEKIIGNVFSVTQQAFLDQTVIATPATGHQNSVRLKFVPVIKHALTA